MKILMASSSLVSLFYLTSSHPVLLMLFILIQTILICVLSWIKLKISWFSYILFLIFLGGLMVLFIYITSLASNELILMNMSLWNFFMLFLASIITLFLFNLNMQQKLMESTFLFKTFNFMYAWNMMIMVMAAMIYLLLTLIIVVKISNKFEAPIKNLIFK